MSVVEQIKAMRDEAVKQQEELPCGLSRWEQGKGQIEMANRVLALLDGAVEVEGWEPPGHPAEGILRASDFFWDCDELPPGRKDEGFRPVRVLILGVSDA